MSELFDIDAIGRIRVRLDTQPPIYMSMCQRAVTVGIDYMCQNVDGEILP